MYTCPIMLIDSKVNHASEGDKKMTITKRNILRRYAPNSKPNAVYREVVDLYWNSGRIVPFKISEIASLVGIPAIDVDAIITDQSEYNCPY